MATKEASIKVTIRRQAYETSLRSMVASTAEAGRKMGRALKEPMSKGIEAAKSSFNDLVGTIKNGVSVALSLGGALSFGTAIKTATDSQKAYLQLAHSLSTFSKETVTAAEAQAMVERVADDTRVNIDELQRSMLQLASAAGKVDIEKLLERAVSQARRLGMEGTFVSRVYTRLVAKGVAKTAEEAENLTEQFNTLFRQMLGVDIDEAIDPMDVAELAGFINTTGNTAAEMLRLISLGGEKIAKDFGKANEIVEELGLSLKQTKGIEDMTKKLKLPKGVIKATNSALENMLAIADRGPEKFSKMADAMAGDIAGQALKQIVGEELIVKARTGKVTKKEWELRVGQLRKELKDLSDLTVDRKAVEKADAAHKETMSAKFDHAMNKMKEAFTQPGVVKAIDKLADHLPKLAEALADLVSFVAENPLKALGIGAGIKVGGAALTGFGGTLMKGMGESYVNALKGAFGFGKKEMISAASSSGKIAQTAAKLASDKTVGAATSVASKIVGIGTALTAGVAVGGMVHKFVTGPQAEAAAKKTEKAAEARFEAREILRHPEKAAPEEKLAAIKKVREAQEDLPGSLISMESAMGFLAAAFTDVKHPMTAFMEESTKLVDTEFQLKNSIKEQIQEQTKQTEAMRRLRASVNAVTDEFTLMSHAAPTGLSRGGGPRGTEHLAAKPGAEAKSQSA